MVKYCLRQKMGLQDMIVQLTHGYPLGKKIMAFRVIREANFTSYGQTELT